mgnify:CR=1 FL=1
MGDAHVGVHWEQRFEQYGQQWFDQRYTYQHSALPT